MKTIRKLTGEFNGKKVVGLIGKEFAVQPYYVGATVILNRTATMVRCTGNFNTLEEAEQFAASKNLH